MPELTGEFETGRLRRIAGGPVTVAIARTIDLSRREEFEKWSEEILDAANRAEGSLGGSMLAPAEPGDPYHMIFRFADAMSLRAWERSPDRQRLRELGEQYILSERVTVTAGAEEFFDALSHVPKKRSRLLRFVTDLAWVYPVSLFFALVLSPYVARLEVVPRVLVSTAFIGATSKYATEPLRRRWRQRRMLPQNSVTV